MGPYLPIVMSAAIMMGLFVIALFVGTLLAGLLIKNRENAKAFAGLLTLAIFALLFGMRHLLLGYRG